MRIVADANMCDVHTVFSHLGEVEELGGRDINRALLADADILLVRSVTRVDAALLEGTRVKFVGTATSGFDHVDRAALKQLGIHFAYAPGSNANSVLEYVLSAIACCEDRLEGLLHGGRFGIIGYGVIGRRLHQRLQDLGIPCVAYDPWLDQSAHPALGELDAVLDCDVISIHAELTRREPYPSWHLLDTAALSRISPDALLISAGRGAVVDNQALLHRQRGDTPLTCVLDVWEGEPGIDVNLLPHCRFATPHIAGYSYDGKQLATRMLHTAACSALGLNVTVSDGGVETTERKLISVPESLSGAGLIRWLQAQSYDIRGDDQRMRSELVQGFDRLRRLYPRRRELGAYAANNFAVLAPQAQAVCRAMGLGGT
jgi:erythronate-4-phosphate dehydrogenase